ncbi:MAG: hypothetical protein Q7L19_09225 [Pseudohongiella sp.]|nr:hypothetical protein [Pseudohongiella sp.]
MTPAANHLLFSYSISANVDGRLTDIAMVSIPAGATFSEIAPGELELTQAQAEAGLGITALICIAGTTPQQPN